MGIAAAISRGAVGKRGKPVPGFPAFSIRPVISTVLQGFVSGGCFFREVFQFVHAEAGPQKTFALRCLAEDLERSCPFPINALPLAVWLFDNLGNGAWPVEVEIGVQMLAMERLAAAACGAPIFPKPMCLRTIAPFFDSISRCPPCGERVIRSVR